MKDAFQATAPTPDERVVPCEIRSDSIVIGPAYVLDDHLVEPETVTVPEGERVQEIERFQQALAAAEQVYRQRIAHTETYFPIEIRDDTVHMLEAELTLMLDGKKKIEAAIEKGQGADRASYDCFRKFSDMMRAMPNEKMRGIAVAVDSALLTLLQQLSPVSHSATLQDAPDGCIPVTPTLPVGMTGHFRRPEGGVRIRGMINSGGTQEDHTNIVTRALGVSTARIGEAEMNALKTGDTVIIDGPNNIVIVSPTAATLETYKRESSAKTAASQQLIEKSRADNGAPLSRDGQAINVAANISYSDEVADVNGVNAGGIGLYRTELAVQRSSLPLKEEKWYEIFSHIVSNTKNGKVVIRTIDLEGDKANEELDAAAVDEIIRRQMSAALRVAHEQGPERVGVMIPVIKSATHLLLFQSAMDAQAARLGLPTIKVGSMVEVKDFLGELNTADSAFYSIGTNDLISDVIGFSRFDHDARTRLYDPTDHRVLQAIKTTAVAGDAKKIPVSVCGDMGSDPRYFALLVGAGIRNVSVGASAVPVIKELARRIDTHEAQALFEKILTLDKKEDRLALLDHFNRTALGLQNRVVAPQWSPPSGPTPTL